MRKTSDFNDVLQRVIREGARYGLMHTTLDDEPLHGRLLPLKGRSYINFASCSYMGIETDSRLIEGVVAAVRRYGTQLSSSRLFMSAAPYAEAEALLSELAGGHALITPTTSLGHLAALPVLIEEDDAVIYDQRLHHSVQIVLRLLPGTGVHVEMVKHNRLDMLEDRIRLLRHKHRRIWYVADGIYSIFGDRAPMEGVADLLARYEGLHAYFDDAHGTGWLGPHGRGHVLASLGAHPRVVTALSLNKSFAASGGCLIFSDPAQRDKVRACGGPLNFSGPIQPPMLGAIVASAKLHLAADWSAKQAELQSLIRYAHQRLSRGSLPLVSSGESPILFVGMGLPRAAHLMGQALREAGFFVTAATFPGVPVKQSGMRLSLTRHLTRDDIDGLVAALEATMPRVLEATDTTLDALRATFDLPALVRVAPELPSTLDLHVSAVAGLTLPSASVPPAPPLSLTHHTSIRGLDAIEWDGLVGRQGTYTAAGLAFLEDFNHAARPLPEDRWSFHYYMVRDREGKPILATFFTASLWKDDMVAREEVSLAIEAERERRLDPYYLTSRTFAMGSLLSEGAHLYLDREGPWREAFELVLREATRQQASCGASVLALRDIEGHDTELDSYLQAKGFLRFQMPETASIMPLPADETAQLAAMSRRAKRLYREKVFAHAASYRFEVIEPGGRALKNAEALHLHTLYTAVKARNLGFNTFELPSDLYAALAGRAPWEIVIAYLDPAEGGPADGQAVGVGACFIGPGTYTPLVIGLNYAYVESHGVYRAMMWEVLRRARAHGADTVYLGVGAPLEKQRLGGEVRPTYAYMQADSHDNMDELIRFMETVRRPT